MDIAHIVVAPKNISMGNLSTYKCLDCGIIFNALTSSPLSRLRKKKLWLKYMDCMLDSMTQRKIAIKLEINLKTAFLWRHRFSKEFRNQSPLTMYGIVEAEETYF